MWKNLKETLRHGLEGLVAVQIATGSRLTIANTVWPTLLAHYPPTKVFTK